MKIFHFNQKLKRRHHEGRIYETTKHLPSTQALEESKLQRLSEHQRSLRDTK